MPTTRFPGGVTTVSKTSPQGEFTLPDMTRMHVFWEDFDYKLQANVTPNDTHDWIILQGGTPTQTLATADGGRVVLTNSATSGNQIFLQKIGESFLFETGKKIWFECLMQSNDPVESLIVMGLQAIEANPTDVDDGVFFFSEDGSDDFRLVVEKNNLATSTLMISDLQANTDTRCSFFYNGADKILAYVDGVQVATSVTTNLPDDEVLTVVFGIRNGEAASKTLTVDYIFAAKER